MTWDSAILLRAKYLGVPRKFPGIVLGTVTSKVPPVLEGRLPNQKAEIREAESDAKSF